MARHVLLLTGFSSAHFALRTPLYRRSQAIVAAMQPSFKLIEQVASSCGAVAALSSTVHVVVLLVEVPLRDAAVVIFLRSSPATATVEARAGECGAGNAVVTTAQDKLKPKANRRITVTGV